MNKEEFTGEEMLEEIDESRKLTGGFSSNYIDYLVNILKEVEYD